MMGGFRWKIEYLLCIIGIKSQKFPSVKKKKKSGKTKKKRNFLCKTSLPLKKIKNPGKWVPFCCTLGGGVDLGLGITYEELCIKFSSILIGPKKFYRHFKKKFSEKLKISVLKKTQNILKIKSCKENANLNNWINRYLTRFCKNLNFKHSLNFLSESGRIFEEKFMENLVPNFQNLVIKEKNFTIVQPQNYLQIFAILTYFKPCIKFSRFSGQPNNFYLPTRFNFLFKEGLKSKIEAFLLLQMLSKDTKNKQKKKKNTHHCIEISFLFAFEVQILTEIRQNHDLQIIL
ncbi:hypothetical protein AGLY_001778 [Aphis glycines]|uniref:Uncharacterized protein n=1 Tax=Aphis glycines TaxID=307491 RepID=A0A6G0U647_APHGL|nr:hypothetical protein AGLY_001778 [Aphis glycines]